MSFAQVQLLGNVGRDPELNVTQDGTPVCKFTIAVNKPGKGKNKGSDETTWYTAIAWRGLAETLEKYVHKGDTLFIQGELSPRSYTGKDGKQGFSLDVTVDKFSFAGSKQNERASAGAGDNRDPFLPDYPDDTL